MGKNVNISDNNALGLYSCTSDQYQQNKKPISAGYANRMVNKDKHTNNAAAQDANAKADPAAIERTDSQAAKQSDITYSGGMSAF